MVGADADSMHEASANKGHTEHNQTRMIERAILQM